MAALGIQEANQSLASRLGKKLNALSEQVAGRERRFLYAGEGVVRLPSIARDSLQLTQSLRSKLENTRVFLLPGAPWPGVKDKGAAWLEPWTKMLESAGVGRAVPVPYAERSRLAAYLQPFTDPLFHRSEKRILGQIQADLKKVPLAEGEKVFLLGHSYGSKLGGVVADQLKKQGVPLEGLIMLETHLPDMGQFVKKTPQLPRVLEVENEVTKLTASAGGELRRLHFPELTHMGMVLNPPVKLVEGILKEFAGAK